MRLREGQFNFMLADETPTLVSGRDVAAEALVNGINPQELLLDLAKGMDEDRRDSAAAVEASFAEPEEMIGGDEGGICSRRPGDVEFADESAFTQPVPIVDVAPPRLDPSVQPDAAPRRRSPALEHRRSSQRGRPRRSAPSCSWTTRRTCGRVSRVTSPVGGFQVVEAGDPDDALKQAARLAREGQRFILVTDLGMPTSGGTSFQGGFEVVKRLAKMKLRPPVLMMTESFKPALKLRATQMGISRFVFKPGLSKLNPKQFEADLRAFAGKLLIGRPARPLAARRHRQASPAAGHRRRCRRALVRPPASGDEELTRQFAMLQRRLAELRQPQDANQVAVLVMQVAREFFERAVLFLVKDEEARGLGGFGAAPRDLSLNLLAREIAIPLTEPSTLPGRRSAGQDLRRPRGPGALDGPPARQDGSLPLGRDRHPSPRDPS